MTLAAGCPRCSAPVSGDGQVWRCQNHGVIVPLWRPAKADYGSFVDTLQRGRTIPTYLPWPLAPGWSVTDYGWVGHPGGSARATVITAAGPSDLDGMVEFSVVAEEPGTGLGARCAGVHRTDPGAEIGDGPPQAKVRIGGHPVSLWAVSTSTTDSSFDRSVFAGEAEGRWLWMVLRPASAALLLGDEWILLDVCELGPELVDLPFGGSPPPW